MQKRQDSALRRYEGTNAELPRLINSHHEELRVLQTKYKKLKELHKDTCNILKEKENELYTVNVSFSHKCLFNDEPYWIVKKIYFSVTKQAFIAT